VGGVILFQLDFCFSRSKVRFQLRSWRLKPCGKCDKRDRSSLKICPCALCPRHSARRQSSVEARKWAEIGPKSRVRIWKRSGRGPGAGPGSGDGYARIKSPGHFQSTPCGQIRCEPPFPRNPKPDHYLAEAHSTMGGQGFSNPPAVGRCVAPIR
jgi:hypothetical protein